MSRASVAAIVSYADIASDTLPQYDVPMKKTFLASIIAGALLILPSVASATTGYVCSVEEYNYFPFGNYGGFFVSLYSGQNCTGSFLATGYACTTNSSATVCSSSAYYTYSEAQLMALLHEIIGAKRTGSPVALYMSNACKSGGSSCLQDIVF